MAIKKKSATKRKSMEDKIEQAVNKAFKDKKVQTIITDCNLAGVQYNEAATDAIKAIAEGLLENARGLGRLAFVLKASNVNVESLMRIDGLNNTAD